VTLPLGADSEQLRRPAFQAYETHMLDAQRALIDAGPPPTVVPRAQIDVVVNRGMPGPWEVLSKVAEGFVKLPQGDAQQVKDLAALVEAAEAAAAETSASAFVDPTRHHVV